MTGREPILDLKQRMQRSIIGQEAIVERLLIGLLANGNLLVEGLPGLAKTRAVKTLAHHLEAGLSRIQFTPDLLPSDITGTEVYHQDGGKSEFRFEQGPIFNNLVLADEINRAPAKVQAALLEAMEERQVTVAGKTHPLPPLFLVMATQNPIEQEGTYPLPEAQMDRFLMHVLIGYPDEKAEGQILRLVRSEEEPEVKKDGAAVPGPVPQAAVFAARKAIHALEVAPAVEKYIVDLVFATRYPEKYNPELRKWIQIGASPRGGIALDRCARAYAWLQGRDHVTPDDVRAVVHDCLRHRVTLSYEASAAGLTAQKVVSEVVKVVAVA
ncbi:MAG TPA: AAA family ATPase [Vicinamibacteria bacterium]|nr:AAA family ATPase [Vicinamibacteria bacterium]